MSSQLLEFPSEGIVLARMPRFQTCLITLTALVVLSTVRNSSAVLISFTDSTFTQSDWTLTTQTIGAGGSETATQSLTGGNPGAYRQVYISVLKGSDSEVYGFNLKSAAVYTPSSQGAILSLTYAEDRDTTDGQEFGPALMQDGIYYYAYVGSGPSIPPGQTRAQWITSTATIPANQFHTDLSSSQNPNFTATGDPITFGFATIQNTNSTAFTATAGYDNWSISLNTAGILPEPTSMLMLSLITATTLTRRPRNTH